MNFRIILSILLVVAVGVSIKPSHAQIPPSGSIILGPFPPQAAVLSESDRGPEILLATPSLNNPTEVIFSTWNTDTGWNPLFNRSAAPAGARSVPHSVLDLRENVDGRRAFNFFHAFINPAATLVDLGRIFVPTNLTNSTAPSAARLQTTTDGFIVAAGFNRLHYDSRGNRSSRQTTIFKAIPFVTPSTFAGSLSSQAPEITFFNNPLSISTWDAATWNANRKDIGGTDIRNYLRFAPQSAYSVQGNNDGWLAVVQGRRGDSGPGQDEKVLLFHFTQTTDCSNGCERHNLERPPGVSIMSPPLLLVREFPGQLRQINVWVSDEIRGHVFERHYNGSRWSGWVNRGKPPGTTLGIRLESAVMFHDEAGQLRINLFGQEYWQRSTSCPGLFLGGRLVELAWLGSQWEWARDVNPGGASISHNCLATSSGTSQLNPSRGIDDSDRRSPIRVGSAVVVQYPGGGFRISVFATDPTGRLHERVWDTRTGGNWVWQ